LFGFITTFKPIVGLKQTIFKAFNEELKIIAINIYSFFNTFFEKNFQHAKIVIRRAPLFKTILNTPPGHLVFMFKIWLKSIEWKWIIWVHFSSNFGIMLKNLTHLNLKFGSLERSRNPIF
jgi:hypothetical protein